MENIRECDYCHEWKWNYRLTKPYVHYVCKRCYGRRYL